MSKIWDVDQRITAQLKESSIHAVLDRAIVRRCWSLMLKQCELQGMPCIALDLAPAGNQKIGWLVYSSNRSRI
jgi:hypothetical protein